ncbi:metalloprotease, partial [Acinetobacter sp. A11]
MKKTLLVITGTLLCVSCTTRPPLPLGETPKVSTDGRPIIPVTFVFTTNSPEATKFDNYQQMRKEIKILNKYYVDDKNNKIFKF